MDGETRREKILQMLREATKPIMGSEFSKIFYVSRQAIVHDIALLKSRGEQILSTNRGYLLNSGKEKLSRIFWVRHTTEEIADELNTVVDNGGKVQNVIVEHQIYGRITVELIISSRRNVEDFVERVRLGQVMPLKELTNGIHGHLVEGASQEILDAVEHELASKGYLLSGNAPKLKREDL